MSNIYLYSLAYLYFGLFVYLLIVDEIHLFQNLHGNCTDYLIWLG